jgi:hypothetical protein
MKWVAVFFAAATIAASRLPSSSAPSKAEAWSDAVAQFVTDPQFYRQVPSAQINSRFLPLLRPEQINFETGPGLGRNPEMGIVYAFTNLRTLEKSKEAKAHKLGIESIQLVLLPTDPDGKQLYPILKEKLLRRLHKPVWNLKVDEKTYFWRKGKTPFFISINFHDFYAPEISLPGPGPFVIVQAGWEEGDSEEP